MDFSFDDRGDAYPARLKSSSRKVYEILTVAASARLGKAFGVEAGWRARANP
jgi:hypothetical protein